MCDVSIIIVNWNTCLDLKSCLASIAACGGKRTHEVIVVDNASQDNSVEMIRREFKWVQLICNSENNGFGKANNQAIQRAKGRYLLFVNSDVIVLEQAIDQFIAYADQCQDMGVLGCMILNRDKTLQRSCYLNPSALNLCCAALYLNKMFARSKIFGREQFTWWDFALPREVDFVKGCFMLIPKRVIQEIGGFDERFFMFCEEADLCCRARKAGFKVLYTPTVQVIHRGQASVRKKPIKMKLTMMGSRLFFIKKHSSSMGYIAACFWASGFFCVRAPFYLMISLFSKTKRREYRETGRIYYWAMLQVLIDSNKLRDIGRCCSRQKSTL